jgi:ATP-binding cassette, subfamily C (CFTR/MRP), member 1
MLATTTWLNVLYRMLSIGTTLAQPFLISAAIVYVQTPVNHNTANQGYGLIVAFALNYGFQAIFSAWYTQSVSRFSVKLRGVLVTLIYQKALEISPKDVNLDSATVLMNVDIEKVLEGLKNMHDSWAVSVTFAIALYILFTRVGAAFVAPLIVVLLSTLISFGVGGGVKSRQLDWAAATEKRVTTISHIAGCMKTTRMLGLSDAIHTMLTSLRVKEVSAHRYAFSPTYRVIPCHC